ncbi:hypothetical protein GCM10007415_22660 [Parapedobacter pyrenivorans]|uniref:Glycerophosphoryl diester phosphodiesterase n=1 Tax=Parapedobacter pyrenivorans TaxID=1305674 RepID=A0A917HT47_9SPHI|nr:glycerophosphoryl diester phosphodiesterase [Parapedobacter pyrenivorans]GGG88159.1 hypothetical protein GCM10007415_22660 [Parapedobacter pyrenivorans]
MRHYVILMIFLACLVHHDGRGSTTHDNPRHPNNSVQLKTPTLSLVWNKEAAGWRITGINVNNKQLQVPSGLYTILYLNYHPSGGRVDQDVEGQDHSFYPSDVKTLADGALEFSQQLSIGTVVAKWSTDKRFSSDILVELRVKADKDGYFSLATPTVAAVEPRDIAWGMVPGSWYGRELQLNPDLAVKYSQGLPATPVLSKENSTMTFAPTISTTNGITFAVVPNPGTGADPWPKDSADRQTNKLGVSTMNRHNEVTPTAYAPVLGREGSYLKKGQETTFKFRYTIQDSDWFQVFKHAVMNVYDFGSLLQIQQQKESLASRLERMQVFLRDEKRSKWRTWDHHGKVIGANGSKNADVGAMLLLANNGHDSTIQSRIPFVRNYKLVQQQTGDGFFQHAALGEYPFEDSFPVGEQFPFASEVGNWVEPIYTTYYTLMDMGNMLLFNPQDETLKDRVRLAGEKLISWQHEDGSWEVAYDRLTLKSPFPTLKDYRPTWYGLLIAHRILKDERYLEAAKKGADWLIENGVKKGYYLGVYGDSGNQWDFATAQCAQGFLDLYDISGDKRYLDAAIEASRVFATSIFTHPVASKKIKTVNGKQYEDWEINQTGLSVEHINGTASGAGPILISSYAGLFVRIYEQTGESLFLDMARAASRGRHAFNDEPSGQAIYYWTRVVNPKGGASEFPHHAYWQIGWITDYLLSEMRMRSEGKIEFPRGFMTPKVGPHVSYGFATGNVYGKKADILLSPGLLTSDNPYIEYLLAHDEEKKKLYIMLLNQSLAPQQATLGIDLANLSVKNKRISKVELLGQPADITRTGNQVKFDLPEWGVNVVEVSYR